MLVFHKDTLKTSTDRKHTASMIRTMSLYSGHLGNWWIHKQDKYSVTNSYDTESTVLCDEHVQRSKLQINVLYCVPLITVIHKQS